MEAGSVEGGRRGDRPLATSIRRGRGDACWCLLVSWTFTFIFFLPVTSLDWTKPPAAPVSVRLSLPRTSPTSSKCLLTSTCANKVAARAATAAVAMGARTTPNKRPGAGSTRSLGVWVWLPAKCVMR